MGEWNMYCCNPECDSNVFHVGDEGCVACARCDRRQPWAVDHDAPEMRNDWRGIGDAPVHAHYCITCDHDRDAHANDEGYCTVMIHYCGPGDAGHKFCEPCKCGGYSETTGAPDESLAADDDADDDGGAGMQMQEEKEAESGAAGFCQDSVQDVSGGTSPT